MSERGGPEVPSKVEVRGRWREHVREYSNQDAALSGSPYLACNEPCSEQFLPMNDRVSRQHAHDRRRSKKVLRTFSPQNASPRRLPGRSCSNAFIPCGFGGNFCGGHSRGLGCGHPQLRAANGARLPGGDHDAENLRTQIGRIGGSPMVTIAAMNRLEAAHARRVDPCVVVLDAYG